MGHQRIIRGLLLFCAATMCLTACKEEASREATVVVYTSVDQNFAEPVLKRFAEETGIAVKPVFDIEAAKTSGLAKRLQEEAGTPQADVFWSGEPVQTAVLAGQSVFAPHRPETLRDGLTQGTGDYWTAFGGRARVLIVNRHRLAPEDWPASVFDMVSEGYSSERVAIAYPLFGTTATHATALFAELGTAEAQAFFDQVVARKLRVVDGNSVVRDMVVDGTADFGLTDTDDACSAFRRRPEDVAVLFPDQGAADLGTLVIPNTVALVKGGPNPETARKFIEYLLSESTAQDLAEAGWFHVDGARVFAAKDCGLPDTVKAMDVDYSKLAQTMGEVIRDLRSRILR